MRPANAAWTASGRSVTSCDLNTKPWPPASLAVSIRAGSSMPVKKMILAGAPSFFRQRADSKPSITGIMMSSTRISGCRRSVAAIACSPLNTEPTTSNSEYRSRETARRMGSLSSASKTRGFFNVQNLVLTMEIMAAPQPAVFGVAAGRTTGAAIPEPQPSFTVSAGTPPSLKLLKSTELVVAPQQSGRDAGRTGLLVLPVAQHFLMV